VIAVPGSVESLLPKAKDKAAAVLARCALKTALLLL
jgi:hypothetical protein